MTSSERKGTFIDGVDFDGVSEGQKLALEIKKILKKIRKIVTSTDMNYFEKN